MMSAGVIGWPIAHSKSPLIHRFWLAKLGLNGDYGRFAVAPERLGDAIRALPALGLRGVNVTVPHKVAVMAYLDRVDALAATVGAVNTVVVEDGALVGYNTDVEGVLVPELLEAIRSRADADATDIVVVGGGGAARAAVAALSTQPHDDLIIVVRDPAKVLAEVPRIVADVAGFDGLSSHLRMADMVINASPLGMAGQAAWPTDALANLCRLEGGGTVFDMVYAPLETPLLAAARARGLRTIDGLSMLIGQAAAAFELFFGTPAPREHDAELRVLLVRTSP